MQRRTFFGIIAVLAILLFAAILLLTTRNTTGMSTSATLPKTARVGAEVIGELAEGYPEAVPKWEGATVVSSDHVIRTGFDVYDLTLATSDPLDVVLNGYLTALQKEGFSINQRDIGDIMTSVEASTTLHAAAFVFSRNESNQTTISASIRTFW